MSVSTDLRQRINLSLSKLSDRDTFPRAVADLESIARGLNRDCFSTFITCLESSEEVEENPRARRQRMKMLGLVSDVHGDSLSMAMVSRIVSVVVRCVGDKDSGLRLACVECVSSLASKITKPPFSSFLKPLVDAVLHEQDHNYQIGSALCLAAAIDAAPDPEPLQLQKLLPKLLKLATKDCFKAKAALLSLIGSICSAGGAANHNVLIGLVSCLLYFLSSKDWAARKAAGEAMSRLAVAERGMLTEFRASSLASLENRRFDTVKIVRDTMNHTLKLWKEIPETVSPLSECGPSSKDDRVVTHSPPPSRSSSSNKFKTSEPKKSFSTSRSSSSANSFASSASGRSPTICDKKPNGTFFIKRDYKDSEVVSADDLKENVVGLNDIGIKTTNERNCILKLETRRALFIKNFDEKVHKSGSRVVPLYDNEYCEPDVVQYDDNEYCEPDVVQYDDKRDIDVNHKEAEDLNVIRKQLLQIENQQSNLLELLQSFMGSSQSGMNKLEDRVNGLEKSLDEISQNLEVSTGRISNTELAENSCCKILGADFLSPKYWKRGESQYPYSSFFFSQRNHSLSVTRGANTQVQRIDCPVLANRVASANRNCRSSTQVGS